MLTIESVLFAALGFFAAGVLVIVLAPLFWARAVRLTTRDLKSRMAITESEIEADRGLMRAEHAVVVHSLESRLSTLRNSADAARVEINRRDAQIAALKRDLQARDDALMANENARRVLERTIVDRVPDVERHLREARAALSVRDEELDRLKSQVEKTFRALDEAMAINDQQRAEITRQRARIKELEDDIRDISAPATSEGDTANSIVALRAELSALRARARDQSELIARLQKALGDGDRAALVLTPEDDRDLALPGSAGTASASGRADLADTSDAKRRASEGRLEDRDRQIRVLEAEVAALREIATQSAKAAARAADGTPDDADEIEDLPALRALNDARDQRAREQDETIRRLRAELAAANDRLARELARMKDELRRHGQRLAVGRDRQSYLGGVTADAQPLGERITRDVADTATRPGRGDRIATTPTRQENGTAVNATALRQSAADLADTATVPSDADAPADATTSGPSARSAESAANNKSSEVIAPVVKAEKGAIDHASRPAKKPETRGSRRGLLARISDLDRA